MTRWLCLKAFVANFPKQCRLLRGFFFILSLVSLLAIFWHAWFSSPKVNLDWPYVSVVAKFHAFIINLNNSVFFFWSITAGLHEEAQALCFLFIIISFYLFIYFLLPTVFLSCCQNNFRYQHRVKAIECLRSSRTQRLL